MKKWGLGLMLLAMLATPMLACGFPLPAGNSTMAVSKAVCAEGESADTCQERQDAYQMMSKLQSVKVSEMEMALYVFSEDESTEVSLEGNYEYVVSDDDAGLGADIHATITEGEMMSPDGDESLTGVEFILIGDKGYTTRDGGETWIMEDLDESAMTGLGLILGLAGVEGASLDLYSDPTIFTVTAGEDVDLDGQAMHVHTMEVDLTSLLMNGDALGSLMEAGSEVGGDELGTDELGDPEEMAMMAAMMIPFLAGTEFSTTLYIGADDGLIHFVEHNYVFKMDLSAMDPETGAMEMSYSLSGYLTDHNGEFSIVAPEGATEGSGGLLGSDLLGDSGLGDSLFGE